MRATFILSLAWACAAAGGEIVIPSSGLERDRPATLRYRIGARASGQGELAVRWTDVYGRVVEDRKIPVTLAGRDEIGFVLDLRRAVAMKNELRVHFSLRGKDRREQDAQATFVARPPDRHWWDYVIVMWRQYGAGDFATLKTLGINGGEYSGKSRTPPEFLLNNDLRWYAENIATDFYSEYHRWYADRPPNWAFMEAKKLYRRDPGSKEAFKRQPSFSDAAWIQRIHDRLVDSARFFAPYRPFFYSLGDETGIADLSAYWDFDFSDPSLAQMRSWLQERYGSLAALNAQWGTRFTSWDLVTPDTTNQAMQRAQDNYSSWGDHKEWMDLSYARALKMGADAVRDVDPEAYVGIGGAQMPGWGGYDYWKLSQALTAIEPYNIGNNVEILRSLNPAMAVMTTAFERGPWEKHRVWYELLHGSRGLILWDNGNEYIGKDGAAAPRGREVERYYNELRGGIGALLVASRRQADPIAIHYSQASLRTEWMLAQRPKGEAWVNRSASIERIDSEFLRLRESWCRLIEDLGLQYDFLAYAQVEQGELLRRGYRVLVLPRSSALSSAEAEAIRRFVHLGGVLLADGEPGAFDEHSRRLARPQLADLFQAGGSGRGRAVRVAADVLNYHQARLLGKQGPVYDRIGMRLREAGVRPPVAVTDEAGRPLVGVETHLFRNGSVMLIGLLSNPQLRVNELGPPDFKSNQRFEKPRTVRLALPGEMYVYDVRGGRSLGRQTRVEVKLDPYEPAIFAATRTALPRLRISAPPRLARGHTGRLAIHFDAASPAATHILHVDVADPSGRLVSHYSGNLRAPGGSAVKRLPLALNDAPGHWQIRVKDVLSGQTADRPLEMR